jgi:hypothetical protein
MWECYNCAFQNVDAAPICAKCRAPKPDPNQPRQGRTFYAAQIASQERLASEVMSAQWAPPPTQKKLMEKWADAAHSPAALAEEMALLERRDYALREAMKLLVQVVKNPQARGNDINLQNVLVTLQNWEQES